MHEKTLTTRPIYEGRILSLEVLEIEMENGVRSMREIIRHQSAVAVLAMLPDGRFVLARQFRKAIESDIVELVAGLREEGEAPEEAARRELLEETGYSAAVLLRLGKVYPSPGYTEEYIDLFFAYLSPGQQAQSQDDDERVELVYLTEEEITAMMARAEITDAKWLAAWAFYLATIKSPEPPACDACCSCTTA